MSIEKKLTIKNLLGLHARPATQLVALVNKFESNILLTFNEITVDMKSIMGVLSLGITMGSKITIAAEGPDEVEAIKAISKNIDDYNLK